MRESSMLIVAVMLSLFVAIDIRAEPSLKALIVDGQNNHDWRTTTPILRKYLEDSGLFTVDVATSPPPWKRPEQFSA
jgi:hypothetical protein